MRRSIGLICLLVLSGCGGSSDRQSKLERRVQIFDMTETREELLKRQSLDCDERAGCPEGVAKVLSFHRDSGQVGGCSGFLIRSNVLVTNGHCLPNHIKAAGSSCSEQMDFYFAESSHTGFYRPPELAGCNRILYYAEDDFTEQDIAIIELNRSVPRSAFTMDTSGVADNQQLTLWKVIHDSKESGSIRKTSCSSKMNTVIHLPYYHHNASAIVYSGCDTTFGNSGSAIVKNDGRVAAVHASAVAQKFFDEQASKFKNNGFNRITVGTNLACVDHPYINPAGVVAKCNEIFTEEREDQRIAELASEAAQDAYDQIQRFHDAWENAASDAYFIWDLSHSNHAAIGGATYTISIPVPDCAKLANIRRDYPGETFESITYHHTNIFRTDTALNRHLQLESDVTRAEIDFEINFDPQDFITGMPGEVEVELGRSSIMGSFTFDHSVTKTCAGF